MGNLLINIVNSLIAGVGTLITGLLALLPTSPFASVSVDSTWLSYVNYFIPVGTILVHLGLYLTAALSYYIIRIGLRWAKAIE